MVYVVIHTEHDDDELSRMSWIVAHDDGSYTYKKYSVLNTFHVVIDAFMTDVMRADEIVGHNITSHRNAIVNACRRHTIPSVPFDEYVRTKGFCTMYNTMDICGIIGRTGKVKKPTIDEMYYHYFGIAAPRSDVKAVFQCYKAFKNNIPFID